jgi:two-component system chemotaxis response regulator CheB
LRALETVLGSLDSDFPLPIALTQHRSKIDSVSLASVLQIYTKLNVKEAEDRDKLSAGTVYVAPVDYHLTIEQGRCGLSLEPPVNYARPSVDVLFESAALSYGPDVLGIVLTGNNSDGAEGASRIKHYGGIIVVQDPGDSEASNMPLATINATSVDHVLKLSEIGTFLSSHFYRKGNR